VDTDFAPAFQQDFLQPGITAGAADDGRRTDERDSGHACMEPGNQKRWSALLLHLHPAYNKTAKIGSIKAKIENAGVDR
jgi:hypothetical protein